MAHALREMIREQMTRRRWEQHNLVAESGLSKQQVSKLLKDERDLLPRIPEPATITGIARAFRIGETDVLRYCVRALGIEDVAAPTIVYELEQASDDDLLSELQRRLVGTRAFREARNQHMHGMTRAMSGARATLSPAALETEKGLDEESGGSDHDEG